MRGFLFFLPDAIEGVGSRGLASLHGVGVMGNVSYCRPVHSATVCLVHRFPYPLLYTLRSGRTWCW